MKVNLKKASGLYDGFGRYEFEPDSGLYVLKVFQDYEESSARCIGYADEIEIGIKERRKAFAAIYLHNNIFRLYIDGHTFDWPGEYEVTRKEPSYWFMRKRFDFTLKLFEIKKHGQSVYSFYYRYDDDYDEFPGPDVTDILFFTSNIVRDASEVARFVYMWQASAEGRNIHTEEFRRETAEYLAKQSWTKNVRKGDGSI